AGATPFGALEGIEPARRDQEKVILEADLGQLTFVEPPAQQVLAYRGGRGERDPQFDEGAVRLRVSRADEASCFPSCHAVAAQRSVLHEIGPACTAPALAVEPDGLRLLHDARA